MIKPELIEKLIDFGFDEVDLQRLRKEELVDEYVAKMVEVSFPFIKSCSMNSRES